MYDTPRFTRGEIKHCDKKVIIINNVVYDLALTEFLDRHPGGAPVLLEHVGHDASHSFNEVGHSDQALAMLPGLMIGELVDEDCWPEVGDSRPRTKIQMPQLNERRRRRRRDCCTLKTLGLVILICIAAATLVNLFLYKWLNFEALSGVIK